MNSNNESEIEIRLWDYIDGLSSGEEKSTIGQLIETNTAWKNRYRELLEVHQLLQSTELEQPSMRFTKNVMEEITRLQIAPAAKIYINKNIIRGIAIAFITMIAGILIFGLGQLNWRSGSQTSNFNVPVDLSKVDTSKFFNSTIMNVFMMINVILGLFLLDRYLANKRKKYKEEA